MAVPSNPTVTGICTKGLHRGGQYNPSTAQITTASEEFLQEVKADIMRVASSHPHLATTASAVTTRGQQRYAIPDDHNRSYLLELLDGPDEWRGTAQAGTASSLTLASDFSSDDDTMAGVWFILTGGTGAGQYRQTLTYNNTTKVITPDTNFTTTPDSTSTYLFISRRTPLYPHEFDDASYRDLTPGRVGIPRRASLFSQEFYVYQTPDKSTYGLLHHYYADLSKLDESGTVFVQLLREWRSLWIQGIAAYTMQRWDDERFPATWALYQQQLQRLAWDVPQYSQCEGSR